MSRELYFRPVVETGSTQRAIVHAEAGDADDVKRNIVGCAQARYVTGVGWNLWFDERDGKHRG